MSERISLREAVEFHGHLGPYLVLGILAGELAAKTIKFKRHFGLQVKAWGADKKPKSCLIDGLQLSTGATYGKGNIEKFDGRAIKIEFRDCLNNKKVTLTLKKALIGLLEDAKTHAAAEALAKKLYKDDHGKLFNLQLVTCDL